MSTLLHTIRSRVNAASVDADLAAGRSPETSARHAYRARHLVKPRARRALADNWEHLLATAQHPASGLSNLAPIQRERVHRADPAIRELIAALRATGPIPAQGVAIAARLLTDARGPIYSAEVDDLMVTLALAVERLDPGLPLTAALAESACD